MEILHRSFIPIVLALLALTFAGPIAAFAMTVDWSELSDRTPAETESRPAAAPPVDPDVGGVRPPARPVPGGCRTATHRRDRDAARDAVLGRGRAGARPAGVPRSMVGAGRAALSAATRRGLRRCRDLRCTPMGQADARAGDLERAERALLPQRARPCAGLFAPRPGQLPADQARAARAHGSGRRNAALRRPIR